MTLKHRCLLTSGFTMLSVCRGTRERERRITKIATTESKWYRANRHCTTTTTIRLADPTVGPGCYLPSDGCLSEYSVQN